MWPRGQLRRHVPPHQQCAREGDGLVPGGIARWAEQGDDPWYPAMLNNNIGRCSRNRTNGTEALPYYRRSLQQFREVGDSTWVANVSNNLANWSMAVGPGQRRPLLHRGRPHPCPHKGTPGCCCRGAHEPGHARMRQGVPDNIAIYRGAEILPVRRGDAGQPSGNMAEMRTRGRRTRRSGGALGDSAWRPPGPRRS